MKGLAKTKLKRARIVDSGTWKIKISVHRRTKHCFLLDACGETTRLFSQRVANMTDCMFLHQSNSSSETQSQRGSYRIKIIPKAPVAMKNHLVSGLEFGVKLLLHSHLQMTVGKVGVAEINAENYKGIGKPLILMNKLRETLASILSSSQDDFIKATLTTIHNDTAPIEANIKFVTSVFSALSSRKLRMKQGVIKWLFIN
ncbi:hypothetical protein GQX74_009659 [Glossina fuscipes]|nr:hypothetical protein GQX74_009659 [Glossina fuscipes]